MCVALAKYVPVLRFFISRDSSNDQKLSFLYFHFYDFVGLVLPPTVKLE